MGNTITISPFKKNLIIKLRDAGGGGAGGACAPPKFGISGNPIRTKGGRLCPLYYYVPPIFLDDAASLKLKERVLKISGRSYETIRGARN